MIKVDVDDGKYTFVIDGGRVEIQRFRQDWVKLQHLGGCGIKAIIALVCEHDDVLKKLADLRADRSAIE